MASPPTSDGRALGLPRALRPRVKAPALIVTPRLFELSAARFVVVYVVLLLCIPSQLVFGPLGAVGTPANMWALMGLATWIILALQGRLPRSGVTPVRLGIACAATAVVISYAAGFAAGRYAPADVRQSSDELWTLLPVTGDELTTKLGSAADRGLIAFAAFAGIALIASDGLRTRRDLDLVVTWLCRAGAFVATLGIVQYYTGFDIASLYRIPGLTANQEIGQEASRSILRRVSATAVHPIEFGVMMGVLFWFAVHRALMLRRTSAWVVVGIIGLGIPMSVSRSAIVTAAVAGIVILAGWPPRRRWNALILLPFVAVVVRLMAPGLVGTIRSFFLNLGNDPSVSGRTADYAVGMRLLDDHILFGRGLFTLVPRYYRIFDNQLLVGLIEVGLIGAALISIVFIAAFLDGLSARRRLRHPVDRSLALTISGCVAGILISYATFDALAFPMVGGLTFLLIGLAGAMGQRGRVAISPLGSGVGPTEGAPRASGQERP